MFVLQKSVPVEGVSALTAELGYAGQVAVDDSNGDRWAKVGSAWVKVADGAGNPISPPVSGSVTVRNSAGTVSRVLVATDGVATLAAADALVSNGQSLALQNSAGAAQSGVAQTAVVVNGAMTASRLTNSTVAAIKNGDSVTLQKSDGTTSAGNATLNSPATAVVANGVVSAVRAAA